MNGMSATSPLINFGTHAARDNNTRMWRRLIAIGAATETQQAVPEINSSKGRVDLLNAGVGVVTGPALTATVDSHACTGYTIMEGRRGHRVAAPGGGQTRRDTRLRRGLQRGGGAFPGARMCVLLEIRGIGRPVEAYVPAQRSDMITSLLGPIDGMPANQPDRATESHYTTEADR